MYAYATVAAAAATERIGAYPTQRRCETGPAGLFRKEQGGRRWRPWGRLRRHRSVPCSARDRALAEVIRPSGSPPRFVTVWRRGRRLRRPGRVLKGPACGPVSWRGTRLAGSRVRVLPWCTQGTYHGTLGTPSMVPGTAPARCCTGYSSGYSPGTREQRLGSVPSVRQG